MTDAIPLRRKPIDLRELLRWGLDILVQQARACDVALRVRVEDDVPATVSIDRAKIAWAITALVGNALRYVRHGSPTMTGGTIDVHAAYDTGARAVTIDVQDDGPGIPADMVKSLTSAASEAPGLALGLSMVRDVVTAHGGTLHIESTTSGFAHGTTVRLTLPVVA